MSWTQEKEEKLRQLWEKGHTASQIAEILGDTTRNAVIGKAHRLKLAARAPNKKSVAQKKEVSNVQNRNDKQISRKSRFKSILLDKKRILPCAAYLQGEYGVDGLLVGVSVKLGAAGIEQIIEIELDAGEKAQLSSSVEAVQELVDAMDAL